MFKEKDIVRFWSKVDKTPCCWEWIGRGSRKEFLYWREGKEISVSPFKYSYMLATGENVSLDEKVIKTCGNINCVNPGHLILTSTKGNDDLAVVTHYEQLKAEIIPGELTSIDKQYIKSKYSYELSEFRKGLSVKYGVAPSNIRGALTGKWWSHVE